MTRMARVAGDADDFHVQVPRLELCFFGRAKLFVGKQVCPAQVCKLGPNGLSTSYDLV